MSASPYRRSCDTLGVCQDRPHSAECTRLHCQATRDAVRVERLINSRARHVTHEPMPAPTLPLHRVTPRVEPAPDEPDELEPPPREHAPKALLLFWGGWLGFSIVMVGLVVAHVWPR